METEISRIASWLQPQDILLDVDVRDRAQLFEQVATTIGGANGLDPAPIRRALERREQVGSTALGDRFAVPHACIAGITRPLTLYIRSRTGIAFDAPDGIPVDRILAIMAPTDGVKQDHLELLALVARLFSDGGFRSRIDAAADAAEAADVFHSGIDRLVAAGKSG